MKEKTVDQTIASMRRAAKRLTKEYQSAMGIKLALWADKIEEAVKRERRTVLDQIGVLNGLLHDCRGEVARIRMVTRMREQQHYYGN